MAKGSVRKKGSKWYYRFYVEDESGKLVQREFAGTASKSETEAMLRKAMEDYEAKKFVAKSENVTVGQLLDMWVEEELKPGSLSNGTVSAYQGTVGRIKQFPIGERKLKTVTPNSVIHYHAVIYQALKYAMKTDMVPQNVAMKVDRPRKNSAVLQGAFRFAVFPKRLLSYNPMQYVVMRKKQESYELFSDDNSDELAVPTITYEQYVALTDWLKKKSNPALLPIQIAYFTGLRIGEVCALTWQDIDLKEQVITVRRSMRYNGARHKTEIGPTKRSKIRTVDFCDTLAEILKEAKKEQHLNRFKYGELYSLNYCKEVQEKGRSYYELYTLGMAEEVPEDYKELSFVCLRPDGAYESASTVSIMCRTAQEKVPGLEDFHFHTLRHPYVKHTTKNKSLQKQKSQTTKNDDLGFLFLQY